MAANARRAMEAEGAAAGTVGRFCRNGFDQDATQRRGRRRDFRGFDDARTIKNRIGEFAGMKNWNGSGTWELDYSARLLQGLNLRNSCRSGWCRFD